MIEIGILGFTSCVVLFRRSILSSTLPYKQYPLEIDKKSSNAKQNPEAKLLLFENYSASSSTLSSKSNRRYSENKQKNKCVCIQTINHNKKEDENEK